MPPPHKRTRLFLLLALFAITLRLLMLLRGHNSDLAAWHEIGASPMGNNLYTAFPIVTNWGPPLYWLFQICYRLPGGQNIGTFHLYLAIFFSLCDLFSAAILLRIFGLFAAALFLFNPAEAIVSGYHANVEPALIACILAALYFATQSQHRRKNELFYLFIGLSLAMKHALIIFPLWLFMQPASRRERIKSVLIPYGTMLLFLLPFLILTPMQVIKNVFLYTSFANNGLIPRAIIKFVGIFGVDAAGIPASVWIATFLVPLLLIGWLARNFDRKQLLLLYAPALIGLSSAIALQYFALPAYSFAASPTIATWLYNLFNLYLFAGRPEELHLYNLPERLNLNFNNPGWHFLQLLCLVWVYQQIRKPRAQGIVQ